MWSRVLLNRGSGRICSTCCTCVRWDAPLFFYLMRYLLTSGVCEVLFNVRCVYKIHMSGTHLCQVYMCVHIVVHHTVNILINIHIHCICVHMTPSQPSDWLSLQEVDEKWVQFTVCIYKHSW